MGSGTTAQVCIEEGRKFIGFEIDQTYCEMAQKRAKLCKPHLLTILT